MPNFKFALITISDSSSIFRILKKSCLKKNSNGFCLTRVTNQCENEKELKDAAFYSFSSRRNFHLEKKKMYHVNNFNWMIVKLRMYAT